MDATHSSAASSTDMSFSAGTVLDLDLSSYSTILLINSVSAGEQLERP